MIKALLILISVLLHTTLWGQYTYFNSHLGPLGGVEAGSGTSTNLLVKNNQLISIVNYPNFGNISMSFNIQNMEGQWINQVVNQTNGQMLTNYADSFSHYEGGIIGAGFFFEGPWASIRWFDENYNLSWEKQVPIFFDENENPVYFTNEHYGEFLFAKPLDDGGFIAAGRKTYDQQPDIFHHNVWLQRYDANHDLVWDKEFPFYSENIIPQSKRFLRLNDLFELPNGDLLVWGCWYNAWMPMVLRFDSEGNFISSASWGSPGALYTVNDWLPWPVQINGEEFLFAYKHGTVFQNLTVHFGKPRIGHFDASTMEVTLFDPLNYEARHHYITDFEKTADSAFVVLGYGIRPDPDNPNDSNLATEITYLIKVNTAGEEIWYHEYVPPVEYINPWVYDLEVTPDGGYAFVGNFRLVENGNVTEEYRQWVVKTDACGELEYNGCEAVITEVAQIPAPGQLRVWPNPTLGILNVAHSADNAAEIEVFDLRGKIVHSSAVHSNLHQYSIDLGHLAPGLYGLRLKSASGVVLGQTKVLKQ